MNSRNISSSKVKTKSISMCLLKKKNLKKKTRDNIFVRSRQFFDRNLSTVHWHATQTPRTIYIQLIIIGIKYMTVETEQREEKKMGKKRNLFKIHQMSIADHHFSSIRLRFSFHVENSLYQLNWYMKTKSICLTYIEMEPNAKKYKKKAKITNTNGSK